MIEMRSSVPVAAAAALWVFAALLAPPALAQQVYKCSDGKSAAVYQQVPCTKPSQEQAVREYAREPTPPEAPDAKAPPAADGRYPGRQVEEQNARDAKPPRRPPLDRSRTAEQKKLDDEIRAARYNPCNEARKERDKQLARVGRSVAKMRAAEATVSRACGQ